MGDLGTVAPSEVDPELGGTPWTGTAVHLAREAPVLGVRCTCGRKAVIVWHGLPRCAICAEDRRMTGAALRLETLRGERAPGPRRPDER